ncbi:acyl-CoA dehydrogenase [Achromobacter denitrificans]|nr:acyl-CoA dehydrogenase [Achromobacter denitrificans]
MRDLGLTSEQILMRDTVRKLVQASFAPQAPLADRNYKPPVENIKLLAEHGYTGVSIPEAYGGSELGLMELVLIVEEIARGCANSAMLFSCTDGAATRAITRLGTDNQKRRYLPRLAKGELFAAWSMSEPDAGSDVGNVKTRAVAEGEQYVVNGSKLWCTGAQVSDLFLVLVRFNDDPGLQGVGAVLVERGTPGFSVGKHLDLLGLRGTGMAELVFNNCRIPAENVFLPAGRMRELFKVLDADRISGNPPICLGVAEAAFTQITQHLHDRKQFGRPLADQQGLQWKLADMAIDIEAARALLYRAAQRVDAGVPSIVDTSITKTFVNSMALRVTNEAMQLAGAYGLSEEYPYERHFRDVRGMSVGYGTTEIHRSAIAREILTGRYST